MASPIPCPPGLLPAFARGCALPADGWAPLAGGATHAVWVHPGARAVLRVAGPDTDPADSARTLTLAGTLAGAGVPVVTPARPDPVSAHGRHATLWHLVAAAGAVDYAALGAATRRLHDVGGHVARHARVVGVPAALDHEQLRATVHRLRAAGALSGPEQALLEPWVDRLARDAETLGYTTLTDPATAAADPRARLVHDDLWEKNAIPLRAADGTAGVVLADCDDLAWGPADYDLAFLTRGVEAGAVTVVQAAAFAEGYGAPLPDLDTAWALARAHRLRWVLRLAGRRTWLPAAREVLAGELPLWAGRHGPRPGR